MADDQKLLSSITMLMHLLLALLLVNHASAQLNITQKIYTLCNTAKFSSNSNFSRNLNNTLHLLSKNLSSSLYSSASTISNISSISNTSSSISDNVFAAYQCRGDLSFSDCSTCVTSILSSLPCNSPLGIRVQLLGCFFRYEYFDFRGIGETTFVKQNCSNSTNPNSSYQGTLASVLNATATAAPSHGGFYASNQVTNGGDTAYALAQCLGYLTPTQCATCLAQVSSHNVVCRNAVAGQVYFVTCYYLYSNTPLLLPSPEVTKAGSKIPIVVGTLAGVIFLAAASGALFLFWRRKQTKIKSSKTDDLSGQKQKFQLVAARFSLDELLQATENFHSKNKLGEGGFGPVYKGRLENNTEVAIKMLSSKSHQGKQEFLNEVNLITNVQHPNLIQLLGCCVEDSHRLLVYEYLPNTSLDLHLFVDTHDISTREVHHQHTLPCSDVALSLPAYECPYSFAITSNNVNRLDWRTRMEILLGIAKGLEYLHEDSHLVHRDIKTSNILLDNTFSPKIGDFGLARFFADDVSHTTTRLAGTLGYLAPEYAINGKLTEKADVYSFGLVTLEIVSGRRIIDQRLPHEKEQLLPWTWTLYERQEQLQIVDPKLDNGEVNAGDVIRVVHVALLCTQTWPGSRPAMSQVVAMLSGQSEILAIPTKPTIISMDGNEDPILAAETLSSSNSDSSHPRTASSEDVSVC